MAEYASLFRPTRCHPGRSAARSAAEWCAADPGPRNPGTKVEAQRCLVSLLSRLNALGRDDKAKGLRVESNSIARPALETCVAWLIVGALLVSLPLDGGGASAQGTWTRGAPMPSKRTEVAVAEVGGKIYVVGGFGGQRELEIYDPAADRWSRGTAFPHAVHHAAAVGLNGKLYVIGGYVQ